MEITKIIIDGYDKATPNYVIDEKLLVSYFVREAQKAYRNEFYEYNDFFDDCQRLIAEGIENIEYQLKQAQKECDYWINCITQSGGYKDGATGNIINDPDKIQEIIDWYTNDKANKKREHFSVQFTNTTIKFSYDNLLKIEKAIAQAKAQLITPLNKILQKQLKTNLTDTQLKKLHELLIADGFIHVDTDKDGFIWAFGGENDKYTDFKIIWLKNVYFLIDLLRGIKHNDITLAEIKRRAMQYFTDENDKQLKITGYKKLQGRPEYKRIQTILRTLTLIN